MEILLVMKVLQPLIKNDRKTIGGKDMKAAILQRVLLVFLFSSITCIASAEWQLDNEASNIHFVSIKKSKAAEIHSFGMLKGTLKQNGDASVIISLSSVETKIPIRDDRMKSMLFEVGLFPEAAITAQVDISRINAMKVGDSVEEPVQLALSLHGQQKTMEAGLRISRLADNRLMVTTIEPLIVNADDYALGQGVEALRNVAKLPSISTAVPVTVNLIFAK